ncbi:uncharacterized protein [Chironomus tepperi]|uniref:uncharacterized protein isoform X2 n=1 Tax=Chironomus tepperi TaxID=113505 RepID=UPI00391FBE74
MDIIPEHLMIRVFKILDKNSIKTASKVCKRWQNIINSSSAIINRLDTIFNMKSSNKLTESLKELDIIPYKSVIFRAKFYQDKKLLKQSLTALEKYKNHIEKIEFFLASSSTILQTINALSSDKITNLTISQSYKELIDDTTALHLPNLKSLETHQASGMLKMIKSHKIENLKIIHDYDDYDTVDDKINDFLVTCPDLKTLLFEHHFPIIDVDKMSFKLTHLTVSNIEERQKLFSSRQLDSLKKLIEANSDTLELFLLGNYGGVEGLLEFMLPKAKMLQYLFLVCPTFNTIEDNIPKNHSITDMALTLAHHCDSNVGKTRKIIRACPGLQKLSLNSITHDVSPLIQEAACSLPNLKDLSIFSTKGRSFKNIPKLKELEILYIERITSQSDIKPLINLLLAAPKLKKLKIELWGGDRLAFLSKDRLRKVLTSCTELEEIFIGGLFKLPNSFIDGLIETESNLKHLIIETYDVEMIQKNAEKLLDTKIRCTALQWYPKRKNEDESKCSDDEDYDFVDEAELEANPEVAYMDFDEIRRNERYAAYFSDDDDDYMVGGAGVDRGYEDMDDDRFDHMGCSAD